MVDETRNKDVTPVSVENQERLARRAFIRKAGQVGVGVGALTPAAILLLAADVKPASAFDGYGPGCQGSS